MPPAEEFVAMTAALAISTGIVAIFAGVLRLGFLASFIPEPVLKGFIISLALTIIVGQLPKLFGVEKGSGDFFQKLWDLITKLGDTQSLTLLVGLLSLAIVLGLRRLAPAVPLCLPPPLAHRSVRPSAAGDTDSPGRDRSYRDDLSVRYVSHSTALPTRGRQDRWAKMIPQLITAPSSALCRRSRSW